MGPQAKSCAALLGGIPGRPHVQPSDRVAVLTTAKPVLDLTERYKDGLKQHERSVLQHLLTQYLDVERVRLPLGARA